LLYLFPSMLAILNESILSPFIPLSPYLWLVINLWLKCVILKRLLLFLRFCIPNLAIKLFLPLDPFLIESFTIVDDLFWTRRWPFTLRNCAQVATSCIFDTLSPFPDDGWLLWPLLVHHLLHHLQLAQRLLRVVIKSLLPSWRWIIRLIKIERFLINILRWPSCEAVVSGLSLLYV